MLIRDLKDHALQNISTFQQPMFREASTEQKRVFLCYAPAFSSPSEIFSPESAGSTKMSRVMDDSSTQGMSRFRA